MCPAFCFTFSVYFFHSVCDKQAGGTIVDRHVASLKAYVLLFENEKIVAVSL